MSNNLTIAISPSGVFPNESAMINRLFDAGLHRYHIDKTVATEQSIAEILEGVELKYLGKITLHSHFHLVLAYGVGGIHYSLEHRKVLGDDYPSKVQLYKGFGVKVSTDVDQDDYAPADYALSQTALIEKDESTSVFILTDKLQEVNPVGSALFLETILNNYSVGDIVQVLSNGDSNIINPC